MSSSPSSVQMRRLRRSAAMRGLVRETRLSPAQFVLPLFVTEGKNVERPIAPMPGHSQWSVDRITAQVDRAVALGVQSVLLFGIPDVKDAVGSGAADPKGPVARALAAIKKHAPGVVVIADVCLCEYTDHGHCGIVSPQGEVKNAETLPLLAGAAVAYADAGADIVAPSAMMDGQVAAIRAGLDGKEHGQVAVMAYAAKSASAFYGPFRVAAGSTPAFGDRRAYQMDPAKAREALREVDLDIEEGADLVMVKPAGPCLDIIRRVRERTDLPLAAYQVSGEYAMLKAAAERGWLDERRAAMESLVAIARAGADIIITYHALDAARWIREEG
ncbi:MAG TPA: porphobilinogen synthase [Gemmatimonadales bacterium]|nr:porphobilinogen synthase [Gemmatimonadales bacterium]